MNDFHVIFEEDIIEAEKKKAMFLRFTGKKLIL